MYTFKISQNSHFTTRKIIFLLLFVWMEFGKKYVFGEIQLMSLRYSFPY